MYSDSKTILCAGLALACVAAAPQVRAAELEEITVTAERRETTLQSTPIAVSAFTGATLEEHRIDNPVELDKQVPGLSITPVSASPSTVAVGLRGQAEQTGGIALSESAVAFYIDDVYQARLAGANLEFTDIDRIEVLRGPQGTLYGRNSIAGALKIVTHEPGNEFYANGTISYGSFNDRVVKGAVGGPLVEDKLAASFAFLYRENDGYSFNVPQNRDEGWGRRLAGRVTLKYFGNEAFSAKLILGGGSDRNDGFRPTPISFNGSPTTTRGITLLSGSPDITYSPTPAVGETDQYSVSLDASYKFDQLTLRSITGYGHLYDRFRADFTGGVKTGPNSYIAGFDRDANDRNQQVTQEFQAIGTPDAIPLTYVAGLFFFHEDGTQVLVDRFSGLTLLPTTLNNNTESYAAFGQASYSPTDAIRLTAGVRYSQDRKRLDATIQNGFTFPFALVPVNLAKSFTSITPKFEADYTFVDKTLVYASVGRGFKAGGFNGLAVADPSILRAPFQPETVWSYELGVKSDFFDHRLRVNLAGFYADYSQLQQTAIVNPASFSFAVQNVGQASVYGGELEVSAAPIDGLNLYGNLSLQSEDYGTLDPRSTAAINKAKRLPITPHRSGLVGADYRMPFVLGSFAADLVTGTQVSYRGPYYPTVDNTLKIEGLWNVDAYVGIADPADRWQLRVFAKNLADARDIYCCSTTTFGGYITPPRMIRGELILKY